MKKYILFILLSQTLNVFSQNENKSKSPYSSDFELGNGLNFSFNDSGYLFKIGGMIQPYIAMDQIKGKDADFLLNSKRTYFSLSGKAVKEKVEFFIQSDFSLGKPLLDAYISYLPFKNTNISFGQKMSISNNREMQVMEDRLQFANRGILSTTFNATGREFGVFISQKIKLGPVVVEPQIAVTSGDGRNSFGADSRDVDLGGFKYSGRLDLYPFGSFTKDNDKLIADLAYESKPKMVIGAAASYNDGASQKTGEGHGDFFLYNALGQNQLPDFRKLAADVLFKFKGFSFLGEYMVSTATNLDGTYLDQTANILMIPTQISEFVSLGSGYNAQLGYVSKGGYGFDFRYGAVNAEFSENMNSLVMDTKSYTVGLSRYFKGNGLKMQLGYSYFDYAKANSNTLVDLLVQLMF